MRGEYRAHIAQRGMSRKAGRTYIEKASDHPAVQRALRLRDRGERDASGLFFVEGIRFVTQAFETGAEIETLIVSPRILTSPWGQKLVRLLKRGARDARPSKLLLTGSYQ